MDRRSRREAARPARLNEISLIHQSGVHCASAPRVLQSRMEPYIKADSPLRGKNKPGVQHGPGMPRVHQRDRDEVAATRRTLKKAARREGKQAIDEGLRPDDAESSESCADDSGC